MTLKKKQPCMEKEESDSDCPSDDEYDRDPDLQREQQRLLGVLSEEKEMLQLSSKN